MHGDILQAIQNLKAKDLGTTIAKYDEALIKQIIEYFTKRLKEEETDTITPILKYEKLDGSNTKDAYVAFRRRTERMQTRKNQRNVEANFMNMMKLQRDLIRCRGILDMVKKREAEKYGNFDIISDPCRLYAAVA